MQRGLCDCLSQEVQEGISSAEGTVGLFESGGAGSH